MSIPNNVLNNPELVSYWNLTRGDNKTILTEKELYQCGVMVKLIDVLPPTGSSIYLTDSLADQNYNGITYKSVPDFLDSSFANYVEKTQINNNGTSLKVSNVSQDYLSMALRGLWNDAKVNIWMGIVNPATGSILYAYRMFSGYIDYFSSDFNNAASNTTNETTVNLSSMWKKLDQTQRLLSSTSVHQSMHTGDKFFDLIGILNSSEQFWKSSKK
ncbi:DUF2163 domain-containing protein [Klebsiella grimontii]|uniref:DUF2163 domain-containing protein n=1 Tax=Enterobacteriaceae TaxID=543 RepID=UPI0010108470|nr:MULTISPECIES: DUF2163 domain-containing protein [Enterobacteriaceae]HCJ7364222.1 DUF2163 domain-containing protein [Enterobacter hormaechei subsp. xiangfangensis]ELY6080346.1 DUF2163 domain-containing protein [Cronobacter sakazakii]MCI0198743.1 DUF2163 domain-containing protein [Cronobacter sakazakii]MCS0522363.1 DUF2163 domain-containing protein [Enterobacter hormaechei]RXX47098.1 DUF2163 domain-containing protein [Enterobacter cloacae]